MRLEELYDVINGALESDALKRLGVCRCIARMQITMTNPPKEIEIGRLES